MLRESSTKYGVNRDNSPVPESHFLWEEEEMLRQIMPHV